MDFEETAFFNSNDIESRYSECYIVSTFNIQTKYWAVKEHTVHGLFVI